MTLREEITAAVEKKKAELAELEAHLAAGGDHLDQEYSAVLEWFRAKIEAIRAKL